MDHRLREASISGDVHSLHQLLQEDGLLLNRPTYCSDNPLHVAATLGHADFAAEVVRLRPDLARELDVGGHTPLHLAAANGHAAVAKVLLGNSSAGVPGHELCLLRDMDWLTPIHAAALKGRTDILRELVVGACPESVRATTGRGETALHLAVRSSSFEAVEFLVETVAAAAELLNSKDDKGNTALHLAMARRQLQTMKFMLSKPSVDVNSVNRRGLTPLDVLLESPNEQYGDMALGEAIRAAGGKTAAELKLPPPAAVLLPRASRHQKPRVKHDEFRNTPGTLMVVATLIATITFQAALNPPGGFVQKEDGTGKSNPASKVQADADDDQRLGDVVLGKDLQPFLMFDVIGLFASLSIILLLICVSPRWAAVLSTALAFQCAIVQIYKSSAVVRYLSFAWSGILCVAAVWIFFRFAVFLLKRVGWWKWRRHGHAGSGGLLVVKRIGVVAALLLAAGATLFLSYFFLVVIRILPLMSLNRRTFPAYLPAPAPAPAP
ncbi:ankyrin repeat-containing protein-like [Iris pallida]|uniref:Ankyrin repeat-containing protein-like n=1 Tax=Iris pallida TaxID=29817 RepID=A0AAX6G8D3_IRIPA|nr:ankyrin repeat-containing protein-like [Iris pallida]